MREERISIRLELVIDQRFDGFSKEAVEQDQDREALISFLVNQVANSSMKKELMEELFLEEGKNIYAHQ